MRTFFHVFLCIFLLPHSTPAQEGKVVVVNTDSKELKRTAYRLRISVERVKNGREALQGATDLAKRLRPVQANSFSRLGNLWIMFYRSKAESSIKGLVSALHYAAQDAHESREYTDATSAVQPLLTALAQLDPDGALQLVRQWPEAPESLGEAAKIMKGEMEDRFRREAAQGLSYSDPDAALKLWSDVNSAGSANFGTRAQIADSLARTGRKDQAAKLLDQAITDLGAAKPDSVQLDDSIQVVQAVTRIAPDRFQEVFRLVTQSAGNVPEAGSPSLKLGEKVIPLDNAEAVALSVLTDLQQRPALVMQAIDTMPTLKSKLEEVGGIDNVMAGGPVEISYASQGQLQSRDYYGADASNGDQSLYAELRGRDPGVVRDRLGGLDPSPQQIQNLFNLASASALEHPDLASMALDTARKLIARLEPASGRAQMFAQMLRLSRRCDGEVDPEILKQGFVLVAEIRDDEKDQTKDIRRPPGRSGADMLERSLISELAIDNFEAAMKYVRTLPDEQVRLTILLAIVESCRRPF